MVAAAPGSDPRTPYEQSPCTADDYARCLDPRTTPAEQSVLAVTNPRISDLTTRRCPTRSSPPGTRFGQSEASPTTTVLGDASPCPLTKLTTYQIGDWQRLNGRSIGAYLGLVPTESSSGASRSQGSITKTGNNHARRLLIEAAWHHRQPYRSPGVDLRRRWDVASPAARARGQQANRRLHARWILFDARKKRPVIANTAIARELAGWCWSLAVLDG